MTLFPKLQGKKRTLVQTGGVVVIMTSLGFASAPLYDWFCATTGFGGTPLVADANDNDILEETINIRFDATINPALPWDVVPVERVMEMKVGETGLAFYEATNNASYPIAGYAAYNIAPYAASGFFNKIQCFCFDMQILEPGETVLMPVSFFVDPEITDDFEGQYVRQITLSYTFHPTELPEDYVSPGAGDEQAAALVPQPASATLTTPAALSIETN